MAESPEGFDAIKELTRKVTSLEKSVSAMARSQSFRGEVVEKLVENHCALAKVFITVGEARTQTGTKALMAQRGWPISDGGLSGKLTELEAMDLVERDAVRKAGVIRYSVTDHALNLRLVATLEKQIKLDTAVKKPSRK